MSASIRRSPELSVAVRDSIFPFLTISVLSHAEFDVLPNGDLLTPQEISGGAIRLFAHVNWFEELRRRMQEDGGR